MGEGMMLAPSAPEVHISFLTFDPNQLSNEIMKLHFWSILSIQRDTVFSLQTIIRLSLERKMLHHVELKKKNLKEISRVSIVTQAGLDLVILLPHLPESWEDNCAPELS